MYRPVMLLLALGSLIIPHAASEPPAIAPVPDRLELAPAGVVERYGRPDFAVSDLLVYRRSFAELPAAVAFFASDGLISEVSFAFAAEDRDASRLRKDADRVLKRLRVLYGRPSSVVREPGGFKSHLWRDARGEMLHTVVYAADREEHSLRLARRPPNPEEASK
ncbi:MAG: hypothetical protein ACOCWX_06975 [Spirochaetota bacterium]